jgi:hypothetical protein
VIAITWSTTSLSLLSLAAGSVSVATHGSEKQWRMCVYMSTCLCMYIQQLNPKHNPPNKFVPPTAHITPGTQQTHGAVAEWVLIAWVLHMGVCFAPHASPDMAKSLRELGDVVRVATLCTACAYDDMMMYTFACAQ